MSRDQAAGDGPRRSERWAPWVPAVLGLAMFSWALVGSRSLSIAVFWGLVAVTLSGPGTLAVVMTARRRRRSEVVRQWADVHGWHYDRVSGAVPRAGRDVLRTVLDGIAVTSYTTTAARDMTSEHAPARRHAVSATVPAAFPSLVVLPEALTRRPGAAPLAPDIQFESAAFNARWRVHCCDATFAHAFCHPRVMERLLRADAAGVSLLVDGRDLVVHAPGPTVLDAVEARAALVADLARLVPPYLVARYPAPTRRTRGGAAGGDWLVWVLLLWPMAFLVWLLVAAAEAGRTSSVVGLAALGALYATAMVLAGRSERRRKRAKSQARADAERPPSLPADS